MRIGRAEIATLIPHAEDMCLLDGVLDWDESSIRCISAQHRAARNPLRRGDRLDAVCGVEFAAQAMAAHGRLVDGAEGKPRAGYLASLRDLTLRQDRLDLLAGDLVISAERLMGDGLRVIYGFALQCDGAELLSGRAAVVLDAAST